MGIERMYHTAPDLLNEEKQPRRRRNRFKNRSRLEIVSTILTRARNGALKTHLMYGANLSFPLVEEYLDVLLRAGLLSNELEGEQSLKYKTTGKGLELLEHYEAILSLLGDQSFVLSGCFQNIGDPGTTTPFVKQRIRGSPRIEISRHEDSNVFS